MSQNFRYFTLGLFSLSAVVRNLRHHLVAVYSALCMFSGHKYILIKLCVVRDDKTVVLPGTSKSTYHLGNPSRQDTQHPGLSPLPRSLRKQRNLYHIPVESAVHLILRNIQILFPALHLHKTKAPGIADEGSRQNTAIRQRVFPLRREHEFSFCQKLLQYTAKLFSFLSCHLKQDSQFLLLHGHISRILCQVTNHSFSFFPVILFHPFSFASAL